MSRETRIVLFEKQMFTKPFQLKVSDRKRLSLFIHGIGGLDVLYRNVTHWIHPSSQDIINQANIFIKNDGTN
jgi:hypothetical protein